MCLSLDTILERCEPATMGDRRMSPSGFRFVAAALIGDDGRGLVAADAREDAALFWVHERSGAARTITLGEIASRVADLPRTVSRRR